MSRVDQLEPWPALLQWAEFLVVLICYSMLGGAFAAAAALGSNWLWRLRGGMPVAFLVGTWAVIGLPALYAQAATIIDAAGKVLTGHACIVQRLLESSTCPPLSPPMRMLATIMSLTLPLAGGSAAALYLLAPPSRPFELMRLQARIATHTTAIALDRFRRRVDEND